MSLTKMPARFIGGDSLDFVLSAAAGAYPASEGWSVALTLTPMAGGTKVVAAATGGSTSWNVTLTSAATNGLTGNYRYLFAATKGGERSTIAFGTVEILPNPATDSTDQRSQAQRTLDAIDAVLEGRASKSDLKVEFADGRSIERLSHGELIELRKYFAGRVAAERRGNRGPGRVVMRL